jgi:hypothetical protein
MNKKIQETKSSKMSSVPDGFTMGVGPDDQAYLVPQYLVPALDQEFDAYHSKAKLDILKAQPGVSELVCSAVGTSRAGAALGRWPRTRRHRLRIAMEPG